MKTNDETAKQRAQAAALLGRISSSKKVAASRRNGRLGGRPKGSKNKPKYYTNI